MLQKFNSLQTLGLTIIPIHLKAVEISIALNCLNQECPFFFQNGPNYKFKWGAKRSLL